MKLANNCLRTYLTILDTLIESHLRPHEDLWLRVRTDAWQDAAMISKNSGFEYFGFLSAIDWHIAPEGRYEDTEFDAGLTEEDEEPVEVDSSTGHSGGDTRFQVLMQLYSLRDQVGVILKSDVGEDMTVDTIRDVFPGADWHGNVRPTRCSGSLSVATQRYNRCISPLNSKVTLSEKIFLS